MPDENTMRLSFVGSLPVISTDADAVETNIVITKQIAITDIKLQRHLN